MLDRKVAIHPQRDVVFHNELHRSMAYVITIAAFVDNDFHIDTGVLRRNPRFFRPPKLSPVEQLYAVSAQLTIRGYVAVQRLSGYPQLLA